MNGPEKSDSPIVAVKPANEAARRRAASGAKGRDQGECGPANHGPDAEPGSRVTCAGSHTRSRNQEQSTAANHTPASCQRRCFAGGILRTEEERRAWGRWADVDTIRGGLGGKPPKPSRACAWGRVSSAGLPSTVYSEGGWAASTAGHCRAGGQDCPSGGGGDPDAYLRDGVPGVQLRVPA